MCWLMAEWGAGTLEFLFSKFTFREIQSAAQLIQVKAEIDHENIGFVNIVSGGIKVRSTGGNPLFIRTQKTHVHVLPLEHDRYFTVQEGLFYGCIRTQEPGILALSRRPLRQIVYIGLNAPGRAQTEISIGIDRINPIRFPDVDICIQYFHLTADLIIIDVRTGV